MVANANQWPLFRIDAQGRSSAFGELTALHGAVCAIAARSRPNWLRDEFIGGQFPGIPWFLDDLRPQGFPGRRFARCRSRELGAPSDAQLWSDDAVLASLVHYGEDGSGNFVLGERAVERALKPRSEYIPLAARELRYAQLAEAALVGDADSWPLAGEQPKFAAVIEDVDGTMRHVIVKFSEVVDGNPAARRWADLLVCEHLASELLAEQGNPSASTELVWSQGRMCLEVTRFDRVGAYGRRGCVTLAAWSDAHDGERDNWASATARMWQGGWVENDALEQVQQRWWFGRMIGNSDMHFGNLSFFLDEELPLRLTPNYDMLPMQYRPGSGGAVVPSEYRPAVPTPADMRYWLQAAAWADIYWQRVAGHVEISDDFRQIAETNRGVIARMRRRFG